MSQTCFPWTSTVYLSPARQVPPARPAAKRGPKPWWSDEMLLEEIGEILTAPPFVGEGQRKVWARLRLAEVRTSRPRVLRLMRRRICWCRRGRAIIHDRPDAM